MRLSVTHVFVLTCRWFLWSAGTEDHKRSQQSRTWGRRPEISDSFQMENCSPAPWLPQRGADSWTPHLFQRGPELFRRTFVWCRRQVTNTLIMWNPRACVSWKISLSLTCFSYRVTGGTIHQREQSIDCSTSCSPAAKDPLTGAKQDVCLYSCLMSLLTVVMKMIL